VGGEGKAEVAGEEGPLRSRLFHDQTSISWIVLLLLSCRNSLHMLGINPLLYVQFAVTFFSLSLWGFSSELGC
jgi:hypothetical protein